MAAAPFRIGYGYDVHRWADDRPLYLGGVNIPHGRGLQGHSDADVLLHALCDALLGAVNLRDIGYHFPDTDPHYQGADSKVLLRESYRLVREKGYQLGNLDATVVAEAPKLNPHIPAMQSQIAQELGVAEEAVSLKATTSEKLGFVGRGEGIAAHCVALVYRP